MAADPARFFSVLQQFELGHLDDVAVIVHQPQELQRWLSQGGHAGRSSGPSEQPPGKLQHLKRLSVRRTLSSILPSIQALGLAAGSTSQPGDSSAFEQLPESMVAQIMLTAMATDVRIAACLACTGKRQHRAFLAALASNQGWAVEVAAAAADMRRKRREEGVKRQLVRRLTLDSHKRYVRDEFKLWALGQCMLAVAAACVVAAEHHQWSFMVPVLGVNAGPLIAFCTFAGMHAMAHSGLLATAFYMSSTFGVLAASVAGCLVCLGIYVSGAMVCSDTDSLGGGRQEVAAGIAGAPVPAEQLVVAKLRQLLCAANCDTWRAIYVASAGFSWAFGVCEWWQEFRRMLARNGL